MAEIDPELMPLLLFWAVVVVALVLSTTAREIRRPTDFELKAKDEPRRTPAGRVVPLRGDGPGTQAARRKTRMAISGGMPRRIG